MTTTRRRRVAGTSAPAPPTSEMAWRAWSTMCDLVLDNERRREVSDAIGLSFGRVKALRRIARHPMTMGELAAKLGIDAPYATLVVDELERQGLVERRPHPSDRRVKLVTATPWGTKEAQRAQDILNRLPVGMETLSGAELETLATILEKVRLPGPDD